MGGSILPVTILHNNLYFLFGKEKDSDENPGWSDFGGGTDKGESLFETAIREGSEELTGFLGTPTDISKMLRKYGTYNIDYKAEGHTTYRCHIFPMDYDPFLPHYYNNNQRFLQKHLDERVRNESKIFEKTQIKWFSLDEIRTHRSEFRSFYKNIVDMILENEEQIDKFVRSKGKKSKTKSRKPFNKKRKTKRRKFS